MIHARQIAAVAMSIVAFALLVPVAGANETITQGMRLEKARMAVEFARLEYERAVKGKELGITADLTVEAQERAYRSAQLEYEEALLLASAASQQVIIRSATKERAADGKTWATIGISYHAGGGQRGGQNDGATHRFLRTIDNVSVSLVSDNVVISLPYEARLGTMRDGQVATARFLLLKDVESLEIVVRHGGKEQRTKVYLMQAAGGRHVAISTSQSSQDVELGGTATFDLVLERLRRDFSIFKLSVLGLPSAATYEFLAVDTGARISQAEFADEVSSTKLRLKVYLPKTAPPDWLDRPLAFHVICAPPDRVPKSAAEIESTPEAAAARFEIVPRGMGKIELQVANLFHDIKAGKALVLSAKLSNLGTRTVHNVRVSTDLPLDWKAEVTPPIVPALPQNGDVHVQITVTPPENVSTGEYEAKLRPESTAFGRRVDGEEQIVRVRVVPPDRPWTVVLLSGGVVALLIGGGYFALRLART
jgi:NPCBM-associated, NEW3 domain of alpha-galactosidase